MGIHLLPSAYRHGYTEEQVREALRNVVASEAIEGRRGQRGEMLVCRLHAQSRQYLEIGVRTDGRDFYVFHVFEVTDFHRHLIPEGD